MINHLSFQSSFFFFSKGGGGGVAGGRRVRRLTFLNTQQTFQHNN